MKNILFIETNTTGTGAKAMKIAQKKGYKVHFWTSDIKQYDAIKVNNPLDIADEILTIDTY
ncbi:phosphoribosylglycinamide formyltransferase, partial [Bacillus toyonensis]